MMGGADRIMARGRQLHDEGKYLLAQEILNKLVYAQPQNQAAKDLLADVFEQIGYQQENPGLRNSFLAGAYELRQGIPAGAAPSSSSADVVRAMSTELFLNFLGIRMDGRKADGLRFTINLVTPDNGEKFVIEMENNTLTNTAGFLAARPDLTITVNRRDLEPIMAGARTVQQQAEAGLLKLDGDASVLGKLAALMVDFDPRFPIMPGTQLRATEIKKTEPFEVSPKTTIAE
jgi:alkyl sulfatase BDS1-like metallo-beta-lactamase superfamily hydrolase